MKTLAFAPILAGLLAFQVMQAQQSPSPSTPTPQTQPKPAPCGTSVIPKRVHVKVPAWLQKQIDKQQSRLGDTVDINGIIKDATAPPPCPTAPAPTTAPVPTPNPTPTQPTPKK